MSANEALPFTQTYQEAVIGWMFKEYVFFQECAIHLKENMFVDPKLSEIFAIAVKMGRKYETVPRLEDVKNAVIVLHPKPSEHFPRLQTIETCYAISSNSVNLEILRGEMTKFIKRAKIREATVKLESLIKRDDVEKIEIAITRLVSELQDVRFSQDDRVNMTIDSFITQQTKSLGGACTIGNAHFDELISKGSKLHPSNPADMRDLGKTTTGSLYKKEMTIIQGASNAGKTTTLCTVMAWNLWLGKKVLYISLEEKYENIFKKMIQSMANESLGDLANGRSSREGSPRVVPEVMGKLKQVMDSVIKEQFFMYEWFRSSERTAEKVITFITKLHDDQMAKTNKGFDLVVVDYPQLLRPESLNGTGQRRGDELIQEVYQQFKTMSGALEVHVIAPMQTNRGGYIASVRAQDQRYLDLGDSGGSYGANTVADIVITINRSSQDAAENRIKFKVAKSRNNKFGTVFCSKTDFALSRTHGPDLVSTVIPDGMDFATDEVLSATFGAGELQARQDKICDLNVILRKPGEAPVGMTATQAMQVEKAFTGQATKDH